MQTELNNNETHVSSGTIIFKNSIVNDKINALKEEKIKLEELANKIRNTKEDLINSNLSGETYKKSIENNEYYEKEINNRINELQILIDELQTAHNFYTEYSSLTTEAIES